MKNTLFAILTIAGFLTATQTHANNIDVVEQDGIEQGIDLNDQNADLFLESLSGAWDKIKEGVKGAASGLKDVLSTVAGTTKNLVSKAADLAAIGYSKAADMAKALGIENQLKNISADVLKAGETAVQTWLTNRANGITE